ncbi:MAG: acetyl-CoA carboxylase biotin carboxylase subunit, partial [Syntrophomonadaceae bacterium]|nr:acetyl-CoA carboxylase biotin carboxylase subunit [Syntrophomonadaceae bacterium]
MLRKILIANRGEIAVRIIRACRELGIKTVAIYSTADKDGLHVKIADESVCVGSPQPRDSYLNIVNIIQAALIKGAQAIHPGYGFLAENSYFAELCFANHIKFIGPSAQIIEMMGDKVKARELVSPVGVPLVPGSVGAVSDYREALDIAENIGYPVIIKA